MCTLYINTRKNVICTLQNIICTLYISCYLLVNLVLGTFGIISFMFVFAVQGKEKSYKYSFGTCSEIITKGQYCHEKSSADLQKELYRMGMWLSGNTPNLYAETPSLVSSISRKERGKIRGSYSPF